MIPLWRNREDDYELSNKTNNAEQVLHVEVASESVAGVNLSVGVQ